MLGTLLACSVVLRGDGPAEWPRIFGPDPHSGAAVTDADVPIRWSETENVRWKTPVDGTGWSSPVVCAGRIYVTTAVPERSVQSTTAEATRSLRMVALDAESGEVVVDAGVFRQPPGELVEIHGKNSHASPTVLAETSGETPRLFVHFGPHGTACLRPDGTAVWKTQVPAYLSQHGNGGSPELFRTADGDVLVICCDGRDQQFVVGLSAKTGELLWRTDREADPSRGFSFGTPVPVEVRGRTLAVCQGSGVVMALDPADGSEVWRFRYGSGYSVVPRPAYHAASGTLLVCSGFGDKTLYGIDPDGAGDITNTNLRWSMDQQVPQSPTPVLAGNRLYMASDRGVLTCVDVADGSVVFRERLGGNFSGSPLLTTAAGEDAPDGRLYWPAEDGTTTVTAVGDEYRELATNRLGGEGERLFATFAVVEDDLIIRTENAVYRIGR